VSMILNPLGLAVALALAGCNQAAPPTESADTTAVPYAMEAAPPAVDAAISADPAAAPAARDRAIADLTANADEIARFLAGANPHLAEDAVRGLLAAHGGHHARQVLQIMADDMQGEATTWNAMQAHMDVISDALAAAIAAQFPDQAT